MNSIIGCIIVGICYVAIIIGYWCIYMHGTKTSYEKGYSEGYIKGMEEGYELWEKVNKEG